MNHAPSASTTHRVSRKLIFHDDPHHVLSYEFRRRGYRYRFRPHSIIEGVRVDFYCRELRLIILLVNPQYHVHDDREHIFLSRGYRVVQFTHDQIIHEREQTTGKIFFLCLHLSSSH